MSYVQNKSVCYNIYRVVLYDVCENHYASKHIAVQHHDNIHLSLLLVVYCKNFLCRKETFSDLAGLLMKEDIPLTQKRVSVYLLFVLVASNSKIKARLLTELIKVTGLVVPFKTFSLFWFTFMLMKASSYMWNN